MFDKLLLDFFLAYNIHFQIDHGGVYVFMTELVLDVGYRVSGI